MPPELYFGAVVGVIILVLLASLFRRRPVRQRTVQKNSDTEQVAIQLSRIADALEKLVAHFGAAPLKVEPSPALTNPRAEPPSAPLQKSSEPSGTEEKSDEPSKPHVNLSMFGR